MTPTYAGPPARTVESIVSAEAEAAYRRAQEAWNRISDREKIAYEAGCASRDDEVAALRLQRDILAAHIHGKARTPMSLESRVFLLETLMAGVAPERVQRMLHMLDVEGP